MRDWEIDPARDFNGKVAEWKAGRYAASPLQLFAESDPAQARIIAERTGKAVLCPAMGRVLAPRLATQGGAGANELARPSPAELARLAVAVNHCRVREPIRCGCTDQRSLCHRSGLPIQVSGDDCLRCVAR